MREKTSSSPATGARDTGLAGASMTATYTPTDRGRVRIGQVWSTCPYHAQDGCRTCAGSGVVTSPRLHTDDTAPSDLTANHTERTTW